MEILNQYAEVITIGTYVGMNQWAWILGIAFIVSTILLVISIANLWNGFDVFFLFIAIGCFASFCAALITNPIKVETTTYQVTINDTVNFNEFMDKYDIIDQEGRIYTIRDKGWADTD